MKSASGVGTVDNVAEERVGVQLARPRLYNKSVDEMDVRAVRTTRTAATSEQVQ